jgi:hypothetical protein
MENFSRSERETGAGTKRFADELQATLSSRFVSIIMDAAYSMCRTRLGASNWDLEEA